MIQFLPRPLGVPFESVSIHAPPFMTLINLAAAFRPFLHLCAFQDLELFIGRFSQIIGALMELSNVLQRYEAEKKCTYFESYFVSENKDKLK
jgi:hypothetical protein